MRRISGYVSSLLLAAALIASAAITGCSARASGTIKGAKATTTIDTGAAQATAQGTNVQQTNGAQTRGGH
jgi:hypothetical protein